MTSMLVRQLEPRVKEQFQFIAAQNGRSMEQELRLLITRFVDLPVESRSALIPLALMPLPRWYEDLGDVRLRLYDVPLQALPERMSVFRIAAFPEDKGTGKNHDHC